MSLNSQKVIGIRVLDIAEEGATAIENMVNKVIQELDKQNTPIIDLQVTETNCFLILGEKKSDWADRLISVSKVLDSQSKCCGLKPSFPLFINS